MSDSSYFSPAPVRSEAIVDEGRGIDERSINIPFAAPTLSATVMIATHNRVKELRKTLVSLREQQCRSFETVVADDASTDGTAEMVQMEFPEVRLLRSEQNVGSVQSRNNVIAVAKGEIIIGLDDDSRFVDVGAISQIIERMVAEPDLGVLSFQTIGPEHPERMSKDGRATGEWHCTSYAACGVAIRRNLLEIAGRFPAFFFHMYEEPDFCVRVWDAGYRVLQWNDIVVYHEWSGLNRDEIRVHRRHARNEACSVVMRYPWYLVVPCLAAKVASQARYATSRGLRWVVREPLIWIDIALRLPLALANRRPVSAKTIKIIMGLSRARISDARTARSIGDLPWRDVLALRRGKHRYGQ